MNYSETLKNELNIVRSSDLQLSMKSMLKVSSLINDSVDIVSKKIQTKANHLPDRKMKAKLNFQKLNLKSYNMLKTPKLIKSFYKTKTNKAQSTKINLENFANTNIEMKISSPNSLEALRCLGLHQTDLYLISKEEFYKKFYEQKESLNESKVEEEIIGTQYTEYKNHKMKILEALKDKRNEIINEKKIKKLGYFNDVK